MFIDRESEIIFLEETYKNKRNSLILLFGRRRIGKTFLIKEFLKNKKSIYFMATQEEKKELIKKFSMKIAEFYDDSITYNNPLKDWDSLFLYIIQRSGEEKIVIAIDEITYIIEKDKSFLSIFQKFYDEHFINKNIMFIISGSLINVVYNDILSYSSPLYGRRTGNIKIEEFDFKSVYKYLNVNIDNAIKIYALTGGIPYYLSLIDKNKDLVYQFISKNNIFYNDALFILREELKGPEKYFTILKLIASGKNKINEISNTMNYNSNELSPYIDKLISMDIIEKEYPLLNKKRGSFIYRIKSNYFNFYFKYIFENQSYIENNEYDYVKFLINKNINEYISSIFEGISIQFIKEYSEKILNSKIVSIGKWWGNNKNKQKGKGIEEIDIMGIDNQNNNIYCEVKYRNSKVGLDIFENLKRKASLFNSINNIYIIFSFSGFKDDLRNISKIEKNVILIDSKTMENTIKNF